MSINSELFFGDESTSSLVAKWFDGEMTVNPKNIRKLQNGEFLLNLVNMLK